MEAQRVQWISHRGVHSHFVENTAGSFDEAIASGFTHLETDLRCCLDGHIVLHHDPDLSRTCGQPCRIERARLAELERIQTRDGQRLLTLADLVQRYADLDWVFDVKPESADRTIHALEQWAERARRRAWLMEKARFLCWRRADERRLQRLFPVARTFAREWECWRAGLSILGRMSWVGGIRRGRVYALSRFVLGRDLFCDSVVKTYHARGARVLAYLPETEDDARAALRAGFDEVLTNHRPLGPPGACLVSQDS